MSEWPGRGQLSSAKKACRGDPPPGAPAPPARAMRVRVVGATVDGDIRCRESQGNKCALVDDVVELGESPLREREAVDGIIGQVVRPEIGSGDVGVAVHLQVHLGSHLILDAHG